MNRQTPTPSPASRPRTSPRPAPSSTSGPPFGGGEPDVYKGRIAILVNERTMSRAEYVAMALQSVPGALTVGSTTAGADGNVSTVPLPGGLRASFSGLGITYPDGRPTQRTGIAIDLVVTPTLAGIRAGRERCSRRPPRRCEAARI